MHYEGHIIRPPSEAGSILLQATVGCSHNKCTFCGAYKAERFRIKSDALIAADIAFAARHCRRQRRLFICDGDALVIPHRRLKLILAQIREQLPWVNRVGIYANAKSIGLKTDAELVDLQRLGLGIAYMGLESGDDETLQAVRKGATAEAMITAGRRVRQAGIKLSLTVLLGLAGRKRSHHHARETGSVLSAIDPEYVGALCLMLIPGTALCADFESGHFHLPSPEDMLRELGIMIAHTTLSHGLFHANHASNYIPLRARLPEDKEQALATIARALAGKIQLRPESMRAL
jgi:radical SAM superfamily enzyme YgiQ (UPF0313 family)